MKVWKRLGLTVATLGLSACAADTPKSSVMLLTGQSNKYHNWKVSSPILQGYLEDAGIFDVEVVTTPEGGEDMSGFDPDWSSYDVVVMDYDGEEWPEATKKSFVTYMKSGGGLVVYHGANNSFPTWDAWLEMTGVGGWGARQFYDPKLSGPGSDEVRDENWGPRVYWEDGEMVQDDSPGGAFHPTKHDFVVTVRDTDHPTMKGYPQKWMQAQDECYSGLRGPAKNMSILATGLADPGLKNASDKNEPLLFSVKYGDGRVFCTTLGHVGANDQPPIDSLRSVGFISSFLRGTEWAASGEVTLPIPPDFPAAKKTSLR